MSSPQSHPRRRPYKATSPQPTPLSTQGMQLRKSDTFHSPSSLASDVCDLDNHPFMPRRSPTSTENLEKLIQESSLQRVTDFLKDFDQKLAGHRSASKSILNDPEVLPLPSFLLDGTHMDTAMDVDPKPSVVERNPHDHASDSGLGSSVSGSKYGDCSSRSSARESISTSMNMSHSAITRSFSAVGTSEEKHTLGEYACKQIHDHIIKPILAQESLKDFHPLIKDVPRRIGQKNICNLRDLEKTLIFLAPELSTTPKSYLRFCERSIQLLHATVDSLPVQDQRLPTDRPYTNNYFLDLVEQIRRYAAIMAATREKEANGDEVDEMDYSRDEKITLRGGLSHDGQPVELVREKNGKVIPLSGEAENASTRLSSKRTLSTDEVDDEGVTRSMARRRKSDKPGDVMHICHDCKKEFKRPCDLTKHEKTHSRPWKCTEENCKYFEYGWPTEKERDRHVNDKHSAAPPQYKCHYPPCTYASKRESNCKQHMEKAHGWNYVRSKNNGRKKVPTAGIEQTPPTPSTPYIGTPYSGGLTTPITPLLDSPHVPLQPFDFDNFYFPVDHRRGSEATNSSMTHSSGVSPTEPVLFDASLTAGTTVNGMFDCGDMGAFIPTFHQQLTPASLNTPYDSFDHMAFTLDPSTAAAVPHLSPTAQPDVTLFSPHMQIDEGFNEGLSAFDKPMGDFPLFGPPQPAHMAMGSASDFFPDLNQCGGQFDNSSLFADPSISNTFDDLMNGFGNPQ